MSEKIFQEKWIDIFALNNFALKSLGSELGRDSMRKALSFIYHHENIKKEDKVSKNANAFIKIYDACVYKTDKDISYYISDKEEDKRLDVEDSVKINITEEQAEIYLKPAATKVLRKDRKEEEEPYLVSWKFLKESSKEDMDIKVCQNDTERALKWWKYFKKQSLKPSTGSNFELPSVPSVKPSTGSNFEQSSVSSVLPPPPSSLPSVSVTPAVPSVVSVDVKTSIQKHALKPIVLTRVELLRALKPIVLTRVELLRATNSKSTKSSKSKMWKNARIYLSYLKLKEKQTEKTIDWFKTFTLQPYKSKQGKRQKLTIISNIQAAFHYKWLEFAIKEIIKWYKHDKVDEVFKATLEEEEEEEEQKYFTDMKIRAAWRNA